MAGARAAEGSGGPRSAGPAHAGVSAIEGRAGQDNFVGQWLQLRPLAQAWSRVIRRFRISTRTCARPSCEETEPLRRQHAARGSQRGGAAERQLHLRQRTSGAPLSDSRTSTGTGSGGSPSTTTSARGGLLGHGSLLTVTSYPNRTSPVLRGKWLLDNILGTPPPPPPAGRAAAAGARRGRQGGVGPRAARTAPQEPGVRKLPRADGSARVRARELRRDRRLAHDRVKRAVRSTRRAPFPTAPRCRD